MDINEFTFATITFNQEALILEHLESIKYQILQFKNDIEYHLIICDDASEDYTFEVVNDWVNSNQLIFASYKIIKHKKNLGIVGNFSYTLKQIKTKHFKLLAGDDLYGPFSILKGIKSSTVNITPVIMLDNKKLYSKRLYYYRFFYNSFKYEFFKKLLSGNIIFAPGVIFNNIDLFDNEYHDFISNFNNFEDLFTWLYLFIVKEKTYIFTTKPFVIYRTNYKKSNSSAMIEFETNSLADIEKFNELSENLKSRITNDELDSILFISLETLRALMYFFLIQFYSFKFYLFYNITILKNVKKFHKK
jgi:hypothetical protein